MGSNTYNQIVNELSPNQWSYVGVKTFVITHNIEKDDSDNDVSGQEAVDDYMEFHDELDNFEVIA